MKVLLLNWLDRNNPEAGGAEVHMHETFGRLVRRGWNVTAVTSGWAGAASRTETDGIEIHRVGRRFTYGTLGPRYVRRSLRSEPFDLLVEDLNKAPLFFPRWSRWPGVLLVHHLFGATAFREVAFPIALATWLLERRIPKVYRDVDIVAVSDSTRRDLIERGLPAERIEVVENGVDLETLQPAPSGTEFPEPTVAYVGRLRRYKGVNLLIEAIGWLRAEGTQVRLIVVGEGNQRPGLEREARALGLGPDVVSFRGFVSEAEKAEILSRAWVHALPSEKEGWGISTIEAAAAGTPTVASDSPGLRDSVLHERTGFLVPHGDVGALARRIGQLVEDQSLRERMGRAAREFAEGYSWEASSERLGKLLEKAAAR